MNLPDSSILTNIHFPGLAKPGNDIFEKIYITIRGMENRLYSDDEVENLPMINPKHTHSNEWAIRRRSSRRLVNFLLKKKFRLRILEVGCGNGWLAHSLAVIPGSEVTGLDINFTELQQAARVFNEVPSLKFIYGDIYAGVLQNLKFDIIVFAASIQYFKSLRKILNISLHHLAPEGEIHIINSHFYKSGEISEARKRTLEYYTSFGYPEMIDYYFHHQISDLRIFNHTLMNNPFSLLNRFRKNSDPFYWICIKGIK